MILSELKEREKRLSASQMLVSLLPVANRDTLWALLQFLARVVQHSKDTIDENGHEVRNTMYRRIGAIYMMKPL